MIKDQVEFSVVKWLAMHYAVLFFLLLGTSTSIVFETTRCLND